MFKRKSIIKEWGISYTLILILPLIAIFVNYYYNEKTIRQEILTAHELILDNLKGNVDLLMKEEQEMMAYFSKNEMFNVLIYAQDMDAEFYQEASEFYKELSSYSAGNGSINYWLYMGDKDYLICNDGGDSSKNKHNSLKLISADMPQYEEWKQFLNDDYANELLFYDGLYILTDKPSLVYADTYQTYGSEANIFVTVSIRAIEELTRSMPEGSLLAMYISNGREDLGERLMVIDSHGMTELPEGIDMSYLTGGKNTFEEAGYVGMSVSSYNKEITYSLLVPQESFWHEARYIRNVHLICLLVTLLLGVSLVIFLLRRNFRPVSGLLKVIGSDNNEVSEFEQFEAAYHVMQQENHMMRKTMESQQQKLISSYLLSLLKGRITKIGGCEQELGLDLSLHRGDFALVGFHIPFKEEKSIEYDDLSFFVVDNVFSELMETETFYRIEDGRFMFYLFQIAPDEINQWEEKSLRRTNYLCEFLEEKFELSIVAVISSVEHDISQVKYMYQKAMEAFEYKSVIGGNGVVCTTEVDSVDEDSQVHECHVLLMQAMDNGEIEAAREAMHRLFLNTDHTPFNMLRLRVLEAFQVVADRYNTYIAELEKRMQFLSWLDTLLKADDIISMKRQFDKMLVFACNMINYQREDESKGIVKGIKEYVERNYTDSNLNITTIAEAINRNSRYISKIFKEETGEGIIDYINVQRIAKAKELLRKRRHSVEEISEMVGYASTRTFRRSFVKVVGIPPSNFMEKN